MLVNGTTDSMRMLQMRGRLMVSPFERPCLRLQQDHQLHVQVFGLLLSSFLEVTDGSS